MLGIFLLVYNAERKLIEYEESGGTKKQNPQTNYLNKYNIITC